VFPTSAALPDSPRGDSESKGGKTAIISNHYVDLPPWLPLTNGATMIIATLEVVNCHGQQAPQVRLSN